MKTCLYAVLLGSLLGCADKTDAEFRADLVSSMHDSIEADLADLVTAAHNLQAAAPSRAWNTATDGASIDAMREAWKRTRAAYEHVEGAIAPLFSELESRIDGRYDGLLADLAALGKDGDRNPFDATGVIGMHAIERILYAPMMRREVIAFEQPLPGYQAAAYPMTDADAVAFKTQLVERLVEDATELHAEWQPAAIDLPTAYQGLVGLMNEQQEKINLAASGEEESRYANVTLFDLRHNLDGTRRVYELFREWIRSKPTGAQSDDEILRKFATLEALYNDTNSDALPQVPAGWIDQNHPTDGDLTTPFGALWTTVHDSVDPNSSGSVVVEMNHVASLLGFPAFVVPK